MEIEECSPKELIYRRGDGVKHKGESRVIVCKMRERPAARRRLHGHPGTTKKKGSTRRSEPLVLRELLEEEGRAAATKKVDQRLAKRKKL